MLLLWSVNIYEPPALDKLVVIYMSHTSPNLWQKYLTFLMCSELLGILTSLASNTASK